MKKFLILLGLLCLIGCGKEKNEVISKNERTMTIYFHFSNNKTWVDDSPVAKALTKATKITLKNVATTNSVNSEETLKFLMVSKKLPDIVAGQNIKDIFNKYGMEGKLISLNNLIDNYAPNIKKVLDENPEVKNSLMAADGNIYYIPYIPQGTVAKGWFIRKDWLDKLELDFPKNVEELYKVMISFRDKDPNGNGLNDEIPFFTREKNGWEVLKIANLFGARVSGSERSFGDFYVENGKIKHGFVQPEFKKGVQNIAKWYSEKLIDPEIFTRGKKAREILLTKNQGGITRDWFVSTLSLNDILKNKIDGFNIVSMEPPKDINGIKWEESVRSKIKPDGWAISSNNKFPKETIKYFDFIYGEEGKRILNFGVEGEQYEIIDGKPKFLPIVFNSGMTPLDYLRSIGAQVPIGFIQDYEAEKALTTPEITKQMEEYAKFTQPAFPGVILTIEEKEIFNKYWPSLFLYMKERIQKWILGSEPLNDETWNDYLKNVDELGFKNRKNYAGSLGQAE